MRTQALKTQSYKTGGTFRRLILCLLLSTLILFVSAHLREKWGLPPVFSLSPRQSPAPQITLAPVREESYGSRDITVSGRTWYALQLGAFTQENAAQQLSQEFIPRGAAGYVCADEKIYRVYAAAYPTRAEAQSVQNRLNEQGVSTYIQICNENAFMLRAGGNDTQLAAVSDIFSYLDTLSMKFYALSVSLDKNELSMAAAQEALLSEAATCRSLSATLARTFSEDIPAPARALCALLESIAASCEISQNSKSAARTGAALKSSQFTVIFGLQDLSAALMSP